MTKKYTSLFRGSACALVTPFAGDKIDFAALGGMIEFQLGGGTAALIPAGTTGEASTLTYGEHFELVRFVSRRCAGRVPVIAGCGSNNTERAVSLAKSAQAAGADGLLAVTPYYNKATSRGLIEHYTALADATPLPLILYNVPSRTGVNLSPEVCRILSDHEKIVGIKQASTNMAETAEIARLCGDKLALYSGNDDLVLPILSLGGEGVISVAANILPREMSGLCTSWLEGDTARAREIQLSLLPLIRALFTTVNPIPVKTALSLMGVCREQFRLPLCPLSLEEKNTLAEVLGKYIPLDK